MEISLGNQRSRIFVLAGCLLIAAVVIFQATELWLENRWINSQDVNLVERGANLVPGDGMAWDTLGRLRQWSLSTPDAAGAIEDYRKALRDDPRDAHYWMDLASAEEASGDNAGAAAAFRRGQAEYPESAEVAFFYGNFLLRQDDEASAYSQLRRAVQGDPSLLPLAISRAWRATNDPRQIVNQLLPPNVNSYVQALDYFATIHQSDAALVVWSRLVDSQAAVTLPMAFPLLDELISEDRSADARRVWLQAVTHAERPQNSSPDSSVLWNGDFDQNFAGGGLGWRWNPIQGVYLSFDPAPPQTDGRALRLDFNGGSNVNLGSPCEFVPVTPAQPYHFHAMMRTDAITTESGLRFSITDPNHSGAVHVLSDSFVGTHGWTPVDADLVVGPETHFLKVCLVRPPSRLFDNKLEGTVWIAGVSLVPVKSNAEPRP